MKKLLIIIAGIAVLILASCNVTRTVTTSATTYSSGDTTRVIQTKTIESYDATKRL